MPRRIPRLDLILAKEIDRAVRLARAGDIVRVALQSNAVVRSEFHPARLEYLYEVAYLQVFIRWEVFLEATLLRYLCGHASRFGIEAMRPGSRHFPNIASAMRTILGTRDFMLWHSPDKVAKRAAAYIANGRHETIILSNRSRLEHLANIRHRVAHGQDDAASKFDSATMAMAGRRYRGSRPGRFLRDWNYLTSPPERWLDTLATELKNLGGQIV